MVHQRAKAATESERWVQSLSSRDLSAMKRMRPSATAGIDRERTVHRAGGTAMEMAATVLSAATNSARCCSHSWEWPSASGSRIRTSRGGASSCHGESIEPAHEVAKHARLGVVLLDELASSTAQFLAQAAVVGKLDDRFGEGRRIVRRHAQEGAALALQPPQHAVGQRGRHEGPSDSHDVEHLRRYREAGGVGALR